MFDEFKVGCAKRSVSTRSAAPETSARLCSIQMGGGGGGGGSTQSTATSYNTNIPEYAQPYVTSMLNASQQQLFNVQDGQVTGFAPYVPYSARPQDYVAGFSPMQQQAFRAAANLQTPGQFGAGSTLANQAGQGALGTVSQATGYGELGSRYGAVGARIGEGALGYGGMGAGLGLQAAGAGANYQQMATDPGMQKAYMSPYLQNALDPQLQEMQRQYAITGQQQRAQATAAGAFGGTRDALMQAENQRNKNMAMNKAIGEGYQTAFQQAQQAQQFGANLGLQGMQTGIQGAQTGLQGIQGALAGTAQGMQGAQIGLQGVQGAQAGYGLANQAAGTLGQLGTQQLAAQQGIIGLQSQLGAQQQARQQQIINQAIQDYANAQQYPLMQLGTMSNMLRGLPLQSSTTQQYVAQPNMTTQAISTLGTAGSLYKAMGSKKGGIIEAKKMAKGGITSYDVGGAVEADLYDMPIERLQKELQSPSGEIRKKAKRIMLEKQVEGKAGGGIIAFAGGTPDPEIIPQETATDTQYQAAPAAPAPQATSAPQRPAPAAGIMKADPRALVMQTAQQALTAGDRSVEDIYSELQKGRAPDTARQEYRSKIMEERANARDEDTRQNWLRAAQFFANWGSMPGNTLAAGMTALKGIIPDVISDRKEQKKYLRELDKTIYELGEASRLEQNGLWDKAGEIKQKLGEAKLKTLGPLSAIYSDDVRSAVAARSSEGGGTKNIERAEKLTLAAAKQNAEYRELDAQAKAGVTPLTQEQISRMGQIEDTYRQHYYKQFGIENSPQIKIPESPAAVKAQREELERTIDANTPTFGFMDNATKQRKRQEAEQKLAAMGGSSDNKSMRPLSAFDK